MNRTKCECFKIVKDHGPCSFSKNNMFSSFGLEQIIFTERTGPGSLTITQMITVMVALMEEVDKKLDTMGFTHNEVKFDVT